MITIIHNLISGTRTSDTQCSLVVPDNQLLKGLQPFLSQLLCDVTCQNSAWIGSHPSWNYPEVVLLWILLIHVDALRNPQGNLHPPETLRRRIQRYFRWLWKEDLEEAENGRKIGDGSQSKQHLDCDSTSPSTVLFVS